MVSVNRIEDATSRLIATADALPDADWTTPSVCVGWSRAHVLAHVALNAEGLAGALRGLASGNPRTMYVSDDQRDADIAALAAAPPAEVRERLRTSATSFAEALGACTAAGDSRFERTPGGPLLRADIVPFLRLREVEIHHADLRTGYTHADWARETALDFLDHSTRHPVRADCHLVASDGDESWELGSPGSEAPTRRGTASALAWWASGRDVVAD